MEHATVRNEVPWPLGLKLNTTYVCITYDRKALGAGYYGDLPRPSEATPWSIRDRFELCSQAGQRRFAYSVAEEKRESRARQKERLPNQTCTRCVVARPLLNYQYSHYHSANNVNYALPKVDYLCRSPSVTLRLKLMLQDRLKRQKRLLRPSLHPCQPR